MRWLIFFGSNLIFERQNELLLECSHSVGLVKWEIRFLHNDEYVASKEVSRFSLYGFFEVFPTCIVSGKNYGSERFNNSEDLNLFPILDLSKKLFLHDRVVLEIVKIHL